MVDKVYVWDKFVRVFHWSLVALFATSYFTGEEESAWHIYSGYAIVTLVLMRIVWGFIGSRYARFSDFVRGPAVVAAYAKALVTGRPQHYLGHNPLGGLMVIALLLSLLATTFSGLKLYAAEEGKGPLAQQWNVSVISSAQADDDDRKSHSKNSRVKKENEADEEFWEDIHESSVNLMLVLIALHVAGVVYSSRVHRESLVRAMITGYKQCE